MSGDAVGIDAVDVHAVTVPGTSGTTRYRAAVPSPAAQVAADETEAALGTVVDQLDAGTTREGQVRMARAVADAIDADRHLVVQAGTGTGKTLAYLVPAVLAGARTMVVTATKALQDQLADKDLPFLSRHLGRPFTWSVLKGRSNYLCLQRMHEHAAGADQLGFDGEGFEASGGEPTATELAALNEWAERTPTGDRADLEAEPRPGVWASVSVTSQECPGATRCPHGDVCFAEDARHAAASADVVVVNTHLYGTHVISGTVLPDHDVVIFDEAHQLEDVISETCGLDLHVGRFERTAGLAGAVLVGEDGSPDDAVTAARDAGDRFDAVIDPLRGSRLRALPDDLVDVLVDARTKLADVASRLSDVPAGNEAAAGPKERAATAVAGLSEELAIAAELADGMVAWVDDRNGPAHLRIAPLDTGELLDRSVWAERTAVLTSATLPDRLPGTIGLPEDTEVLDVGSPFDFEANALLYCPVDLPDPRHDDWPEAVHDELAALIAAAGGRTLALFTSYRRMEEAAEALVDRVSVPIRTQGDAPKGALLAEFTDDPATCLFATMSFWQGVDVPGSSLSLVTIDRLPFPRPDEPLLQARRERAREAAFKTIDLPRASTMLAQGAGRLIRRSSDRGVVAVFDRRLGTAPYRWDIVRALPPMRRTRHRADVIDFLTEILEDSTQ